MKTHVAKELLGADACAEWDIPQDAVLTEYPTTKITFADSKFSGATMTLDDKSGTWFLTTKSGEVYASRSDNPNGMYDLV